VTSSCRERALVPVLIFTTLVVSIISSLGAPLLPSIARQLHVGLTAAQWSLTATLLVGAISAPIMGRLGDSRRRRETVVAGLAVVTVGGVIGALATSLAVLVVGRALQGVGLGLIPLTMAAARDHLPRERAHRTIAVLSVSAAAGVGVGYPVSGLIAKGFGVSAAFWVGAVVCALALAAVIVVFPASSGGHTVTLDVPGTLLLVVALCALLIAIAQGEVWGWTSAVIIALLAGGAGVLTVWVGQQLRTSTPLIELRLLRHRAVLTGNVCATVLGVAMYMDLTGVTEFVQAPRAVGYGFSASVVVAGLCLIPFSVASFAASRALPWLTRRIGSYALLPLGSLVVAASSVFFALLHVALWEAFAMMTLLGLGIGWTSAAIPGLIVRAVPETETGSVVGFYQVVRYVGFSLGSALTASILASHTRAGRALPTSDGYTSVMWVAAAVCVAAALLAWLLPAREAGARDADQQLARENAELAPAGTIALDPDLR
jgi:MFS family permease